MKSETVPEITSVIHVGGSGPKEVIPDFSVKIMATANNHPSMVLFRGSQEQVMEQLWPLQRTIGNLQIRGHEGTGLYIFDLKSKTMTGSPVNQVLKVAQNPAGQTCVLVYGNVLGNQGGRGHDDMYAWISTTTGSRMHVQRIGGNADENPINHAPDGFVELAA